MNYQAIIFDLFGTLVDNFPIQRTTSALSEMATVLSASIQDFVSLWTIDTWPMRASGSFSSLETSIEYVCQLLDLRVETDRIQKASQIWLTFTRNILTPRPMTVETLIELKQAGFKIGIISDCSLEVQFIWPDVPFAKLVDTSILSCAVGMKKPDPRIYQLACEQLAVLPEKCIYIGDGSSHELTGASRVGMYPILVHTPHEDVSDALRPESEDWQGISISTLKQVLPLAKCLDELKMLSNLQER